jgi:hypothetical protein
MPFASAPGASAGSGAGAPIAGQAALLFYVGLGIDSQGAPGALPWTGPQDDDGLEAHDDEAATTEDTPVTIDVLDNDEGVDLSSSSLAIDEEPENGSVSVTSGEEIIYTPDAGFTGEDEFEYEVCNLEGDDSADDDDGECDKAIVAVEVSAGEPPNADPVAQDDAYTVEQGDQLTIPAPGVLVNDLDPNDDPLTTSLENGPDHGTLVLNPDGSLTYTPDPGFTGEDTFSYLASDGAAHSTPATAVIDVIEVIDTIAPTGEWISPVKDNEIYEVGFETIPLEVQASDNGAVAKVHFYRWDALNEVYIDIAEVSDPPYAVDLPGSQLNYEWNQVFARVYDTAGNLSESLYIWIYLMEAGSQVFLPAVIR